MALRKFRTGQQTYDVSTYVGTYGTIFYDEANGQLRISDGVTPGGKAIIGVSTISTTQPANPNEGEFWLNPTTNELLAYYNGNFIRTIDVATEDRIGGVKLGPGVITNAQGQIIIDNTDLEFSFGNFTATIEPGIDSTASAVLSSINESQPIIIRSTGTGSISMVGEFNVFPTDGSLGDRDPVFTIGNDGQVMVYVTQQDFNAGAFEIIGSTTGDILAPGQPGTMLHVTGQVASPARVYIDGNGDYASIVGRRWNGTLASGRTQVLANEDILRINATAQTDTEMPGVATAQIRFRATENQTDTAQGSKIEFLVTRNGTTAESREVGLIVNNNGIEIPSPDSGVVFYGDTSGTIALRPVATAGTNTITLPAVTGTVVTTGDTGSVSNTMLAGSIANNKLSNSSVTINGTSIALGASGTVTAAAGTLTGTTLSSTVVTSSLTSVGILTSLSVADGISDGIGNVRSLPLNPQTGAYNLAATDNGKMISITTGGVSVLQNVFADPYGQIISIYNNSNTSQTITQGTGVTLRLAGTAATGNRTLARYGVATLTCVAANTFVISGAGVT